MAVCLKCGAEIPPGKKYCDSCGPEAAKQVAELLAVAEGTNYKQYRRNDRRWFVFSLLFVLFLMVGMGVILVYSIPSGPDLAKAQAAVCRANMRKVRDAAAEYDSVTGQPAPGGRVSSTSPLVQDQYLEEALKCPVTGHTYLLDLEGGQPAVHCDSGIAGHRI
ncbi:MAG: zinc ribbon domain-containing protein [Actinomycetota bacterium]